MKRYAITITSLILWGVALTGCKPSDLADGNVLPQVRIYFPLAEISHPRQDILTVNTHVDNVSEMFAAKVMAQLITEHQADLQMLPFVGISILRIAFDHYDCGWVTSSDFFVCNESSHGPAHRYSFYGTPIEVVQ